MLEQNTDRMIHTIGVVIAAAAFIAGIILFMPDFLSGIASSADGYDIVYELNGGASDMNKRYLGVRSEHTVPLEEPALENYHFSGWLAMDTDEITESTDLDALTASDGDVFLPGSTFKPNNDTTMIALWEIRQHDVTYDVNGGVGEFPAEKVDYFTPYTIYDHEPTKEGHTYHGWRNSETLATLQPGETFTPESDVVLIADWTLNSYDVKYNLDGGSGTFTNDSIYHGHMFDIPNVSPVKAGYTFDGWIVNGGETVSAGDSILIEGPTELKAKWNINNYNVVYDLNAGDGTFAPDSVEFKQNHTIHAHEPTRTGYTFNGWINSQDNQKYSPSDTVNMAKPEHMTLKADWTINEYDVTYDLNGGVGSFASAKVKYNNQYTLHVTKPTRTGYTFDGWVNSVTGATHNPGAAVRITEDTKLTAKWVINKYNVTYDLNGGGGSFANGSMNYNSTYNIHKHKPTRAGHTFVGWRNSVDNKVYDAGDSFTLKQNTKLTAEWSVNDYTVSYNLNGGSGSFSSVKRTYNTRHSISNTTPTRTGYTFTGWRRSDTNTIVGAGTNFTVTQDTVLTAQWKVNKYTVRYDLGGGTGSFANQTHNYGTNHTVRSGTPKRNGHIFQHWVREDTGDILKAGQTTTVNKDIVISAVWKPETYTISYNANGGSGAPGNQTKTYGKALTLSSTRPTRSGYRFDGWTISGSSTKYQPGSSFSREGSVQLNAKWVKQYRYRYGSGGWTTVDAGTTITLKAAPTKTHYNFVGWVPNGSSTSHTARSVYTVNSDVTFTEKWDPKTYTIRYTGGSGSGFPSQVTAKYGSTFTVNTTTIPQLNGHVFAGWKNSADNKYYNPASTFKVTGNITLSARFRGSGYLKVGSKIRILQGARYVSNGAGERGSRIPDFVTGRTNYVHELGNKAYGANSVTFGPYSSGNATGAVDRRDVILQDPDIRIYGMRPMELQNTSIFDIVTPTPLDGTPPLDPLMER